MSELVDGLIARLFRDDAADDPTVGQGLSQPFGRDRLDPEREGQIELVGLLQQLPSFAAPLPGRTRPAEVVHGAGQSEDDTGWEQQQGRFRPADAMSGIEASGDGLSENLSQITRSLEPVFSHHDEAVKSDRVSTLMSEESRDTLPIVRSDRFPLEGGQPTSPAFAPVGSLERSMQGLAGQVPPPSVTKSAFRPDPAGLADPRLVPMQGPVEAGRQGAGWPGFVANAAARLVRSDAWDGEDGSSNISPFSVMTGMPIDGVSTASGPEQLASPPAPGGTAPDGDDLGVVGSLGRFSAVPPPAMRFSPATSSDRPSANPFEGGFAHIDLNGRAPRTNADGAAEARSGDRSAPSALQVNGGVSMSGRRLGQVSASSQVRHASLPPAGQSRVNARSAALYPGTRIPQ